MILNLWSQDQEGACEDYMAEVRGSDVKIFINIACI